MSEIKIEQAIPIPTRGNGSTSSVSYPWRSLNVGDSFFVPGAKSNKFGAAVAGAAKRTGARYTQRKVDGGIRVWRIE